MKDIFQIKSISQFHQIICLSSPKHPLISLIKEENNSKDIDIDEKFFDISYTSEMCNYV